MNCVRRSVDVVDSILLGRIDDSDGRWIVSDETTQAWKSVVEEAEDTTKGFVFWFGESLYDIYYKILEVKSYKTEFAFPELAAKHGIRCDLNWIEDRQGSRIL